MAATVRDSGLALVDPFKGRSDLEKKVLRAVGEANTRFNEDALRLMRAVRLATQLGFTIEETTWQAVQKNSQLIANVSTERVRDELAKILESSKPAEGVKLLYESGLLTVILPELVAGVGINQKGTHHKDDVFTHSLKSLEHCRNSNWVVRLAALIHDIGKPPAHVVRGNKDTFYNHEIIGARIARQIADRLKLSKADREKLYTLVRWHMFSVSEFLTDAAVRRFINRVGRENTEDMLDLRIADRLGSGSKESSWRLEQFKERLVQVQKHIPSVRDLKVNGRDVMEALKISPGPRIGEILEKLFEEITEDPTKNEREYLLGRIKELGR